MHYEDGNFYTGERLETQTGRILNLYFPNFIFSSYNVMEE